MNTSAPREPFSLPRADATSRAPRAPMSPPAGVPTDSATDDVREEVQIRLLNLQQWICELLIKNQQLRMALMEAESREQLHRDRCNA